MSLIALVLFAIYFALSVRSQETRVYPDPANAPFTFESDSKPYYALNATPIFNRVVNARIFHNGFWVLKDKYSITKVRLKVRDSVQLNNAFRHRPKSEPRYLI